MVQAEGRVGRVKGSTLPMRERQQILARNADDTSFTLLGEERSARNLINMLETFCMASRLVINWTKSSGYWKSYDIVFRPD